MPPQQNDHDLLIRVDENVKNLIGEIKDLRDGSNSKINFLEQNKLDKVEFSAYKNDRISEIKDLKLYIEHTFLERTKDAEKRFAQDESSHHQLDIRLSKLEKIVWLGLGGIAVIQFLVTVTGALSQK